MRASSKQLTNHRTSHTDINRQVHSTDLSSFVKGASTQNVTNNQSKSRVTAMMPLEVVIDDCSLSSQDNQELTQKVISPTPNDMSFFNAPMSSNSDAYKV